MSDFETRTAMGTATAAAMSPWKKAAADQSPSRYWQKKRLAERVEVSTKDLRAVLFNDAEHSLSQNKTQLCIPQQRPKLN